jgi:hypothetical protein
MTKDEEQQKKKKKKRVLTRNDKITISNSTGVEKAH